MYRYFYTLDDLDDPFILGINNFCTVEIEEGMVLMCLTTIRLDQDLLSIMEVTPRFDSKKHVRTLAAIQINTPIGDDLGFPSFSHFDMFHHLSYRIV